MTGEEFEVSDSLLFAGGGKGGILGVDSVLSELFMEWRVRRTYSWVEK
jgi:hypothetical protein